MTARCTCDRPEVPRDQPCELHPADPVETDPIRERMLEARAALENAKTPTRRGS